MSTKAAILSAAPESLTSEDKDLGWILGEWRSQNRNIDGIEWNDIVDFVSTGNRTRIKEYMRHSDFRENWLQYLVPQESKRQCFTRLAQAAENFCYKELKARKGKRKKSENHENNAQPSPKRIAKSHTKGIPSVMQMVNRQLTLKAGANELRPPRHILLQGMVLKQTKKHEPKQDTVPLSEAVSKKPAIKVLETTTPPKSPNDNTLERSDTSQYQHLCPKSLGPDLMELAFLLEQGRILKASSIWNHVETYMSTSLAILIRSKSNHVSFKKKRLEFLLGNMPNPRRQDFDTFRTILRERMMESASENSPAIKSKLDKKDKDQPKNTIMEGTKETAYRTKDKSGTAKAQILEEDIAQQTWNSIQWKHSCPESLGEEQMELAFLLEQARSTRAPAPWKHVYSHMSDALAKIVNSKSMLPSFEKNRMEMLIGLKTSPIRYDFEEFRKILRPNQQTVKAQNSPRIMREKVTPNQKELQTDIVQQPRESTRPWSEAEPLPQWDASQYDGLSPGSLGEEQMELAFLLEQAKSIRAPAPWKHVYSHMSDALAKIVNSRSEHPSFSRNRIEMLIGAIHSRERRDFEEFKEALRLSQFINISRKPSQIMKKKAMPNDNVQQLGDSKNPESDIAAPLAQWDPARYEGLSTESLRQEEMELAFLLEQARRFKASAPAAWKHVYTNMSDSLAKLVNSKSKEPWFKKKRMEKLIGIKHSKARRNFEEFQKRLRQSQLTTNAMGHNTSREGKQGISLLKRHLNTLPSTWNTSKWEHLCPESLKPEEIELAFLLEQARSLKIRHRWNHADEFMSDSLAALLRTKSHTGSFRENRLSLIVGRSKSPRRNDFDALRQTLHEKSLAVVAVNQEQKSRCERLKSSDLGSDSVTRNEKNLPRWDVSQYESRFIENVGEVKMELAFLLEQARIIKAISPWNHVYTYMSDALARLVNAKSKHSSFKSNRMGMLVGQKCSRARDDFEEFQKRLRHQGRPSIREVLALDTLPRHWNTRKWQHLCPERLTLAEVEMAFLLEQARSLKKKSLWNHVLDSMSDSLAALVQTKSHFSSFKTRPLHMLIGEHDCARRIDFEAFRQALRLESFADVPAGPGVPRSRRETSRNAGLALGDVPENRNNSISEGSKESGSAVAVLPHWDVSQYEGLYAESLRPEQLELAFLLEQARSIKASSLWSHVHSYMSESLAKWIQSESQLPKFENKRMLVLVGDLSSTTRQDFETFRSILREVPNALKFDRKEQPQVPAKPKRPETRKNIAERTLSLEESSVPTFQELESKLSHLCPEGILNAEEKELAFLLEQGSHLQIFSKSTWCHVERFMSDTLANYFQSKASFETVRRGGAIILLGKGKRNISRKRAFDTFRSNLRRLWFVDEDAGKNVVPKGQDCTGKTIALAIVTQGIVVAKCEALVAEAKFNFNIKGSDQVSNLPLSSNRSRRVVDYRQSNAKPKSMTIPKKGRKAPLSSAKIKFKNKRGGNSIPVWVGPPDENLGRKWPDGWIKKTYERKNGASRGGMDSYWISPISKKKLRSVVEVKRFMGYLQKCNGDEEAAWEKLKKLSS